MLQQSFFDLLFLLLYPAFIITIMAIVDIGSNIQQNGLNFKQIKWSLLVFFLPVVGFVLYFTMGRSEIYS
jgi:hypothetical protein